MSFLVFHMDKFKKEAIRGIQSHNLRERKSHSNPDINYGRSEGNYELHENASGDYAKAVQNRIDDLLLTKTVRKDAVHLCGMIVSSDTGFFKNLSPKETRRFFEVSKEFLTKFVGKENIISAMVHMDEKTPHMHFLHVPVNKDGRLNANSIYTRESLKFLQDYFPQYLKSYGFDIRRGVEQKPDSTKKHLDTREFKQQQNALDSLKKELQAVTAKLKKGEQQESDLQKRVQSYEQQAQEAEKVLQEQFSIPDASMFNFKSALEKTRFIINQQKHALAGKGVLGIQNKLLQEELREEKKKTERLEAEKSTEQKRSNAAMEKLMTENHTVRAELEAAEKFMRKPEIHRLHADYLQQEQDRREHEEQEAQKAQEVERQREEENRRARELEWRPRGMGMGR